MLTRYVLPIIAAAAFGFALLQMSKAQHKAPPASPPVEPAKSPFGSQLAGAGIVEPETENIAAGTNVPGVVDEVFVKVGDMVEPGAPLFRLDDRALKAELQTRLATQANAEALLGKLNAQPRAEEVPPAEAKVAEAKANLRDATQQYERARRLGETLALSPEELTRREVAVDVAKAQLAKAEAELKLLKAGAWQPDKDMQAAMVRQAKAAVEQTRTELSRLTVQAPRMTGSESAAGVYKVLQVNTRPGEYVMAGQTSPMILGHVGQLHVRVDIDENDIARFRPNLPGLAHPRGSPGTSFALKFVRVEPYVIPKRSLTGANTERVDTRVLQVIYAIDSGDAPLYVGQQMDVFFDVGAGK
jgi:multidrug resistance efflux pump